MYRWSQGNAQSTTHQSDTKLSATSAYSVSDACTTTSACHCCYSEQVDVYFVQSKCLPLGIGNIDLLLQLHTVITMHTAEGTHHHRVVTCQRFTFHFIHYIQIIYTEVCTHMYTHTCIQAYMTQLHIPDLPASVMHAPLDGSYHPVLIT